MVASRLARFLDAQADSRSGLASALEELARGAKHGHWIWYVFPQLAGLGHSPAAQAYGIADLDEAAAYLRHPVLRARLHEAAELVRGHLAKGVRPDILMGSRIDALKLVSSMTLFGVVAARLAEDADGRREFAQLADTARQVLDACAARGYPPCAFTRARVTQHRPPSSTSST